MEGFPVDYMHAVCEGVTEKLTDLWFDSSSHKEPWYIGNQTSVVDERIEAIVPQKKSPGYQNHHPNVHTGKRQSLDLGFFITVYLF